MGISLEKQPNTPRLNKVERKFIKRYGMIQYQDHYLRVKSYKTMIEFINSNHKNDGHYFDPDTLVFWGSKVFEFNNTSFIDRVYSPSYLFQQQLPKYTYKVMVLLEKGKLKNWAICDSMKEAKQQQSKFHNMNQIEVEELLNPIY